MEKITTIGLDLAKSVFQVHGVAEDGRAVIRRALRRSQLLEFFRGVEPCLVGLEACASAHNWANVIGQFGHTVRMMPPAYVKAYVKRNKTDAADAEAICEAVTRPTMRFVPIKSPEDQAAGMVLKTRELFVRQRTQMANAMRAHMSELGIIAATGMASIAEGLTILTEQIESRKKKRNDIEKDTMIAVRMKNLEAEKRSLEIQRDTEYARLSHEAEVAIQRAQRKAEISNENATREREIETVKLKERETVERARIEMEQEIERIDIKRKEALQIEEQAREIAVAGKSRERSEAQAIAEAARGKMVEAQEKVQTLRDTEIATRQKAIELLEAQKVAEAEGARNRILAEADKVVAKDRADADRIAVAALAERYKVEAEGKQKLNEAENIRSDANRRSGLHKALVENLPAIIRESVKPMEKIEGIKILHVDGLPGFSGGGFSAGPGGADGSDGGGTGPRDGNLAEQVVSSALRYRSQAPFVDQLLGEIGMSADNVHRTHTLQDLSKIVYSEPSAPDAKSAKSAAAGKGKPSGKAPAE